MVSAMFLHPLGIAFSNMSDPPPPSPLQSSAAKDAAEALLEGCSARAERDAYSTLLAHQRLISILETQKDAAIRKEKQYRDEVLQLRELHKKAVIESLDLKARAARETGVGGAAGESKLSEEFHPGEREESKAIDEDVSAVDPATEQSSRAAVKAEMSRYLSLLKVPPALAAEQLGAGSFIVEGRSRQNFVLAEARARTTSEKIAIDLAESRRKLQAVRNQGWL